MTTTKICTQCNEEKEIVWFRYTNHRGSKPPADICRSCWTYSKESHVFKAGGRHCRYVYLVGAPNGLVKIGIAKDLETRMRALQLGSPVPVTLLLAKIIKNGKDLETDLHSQFAAYRAHGEWFELSDEQILQAMRIIDSAELQPSEYRTAQLMK